MFADVEVKSAADAVSLQSDLNRLDAQSKDSGLTFNDRMQGSKNIKETDSNRVIVQQPSQFQWSERATQGVFVTNDLSWSKQGMV